MAAPVRVSMVRMRYWSFLTLTMKTRWPLESIVVSPEKPMPGPPRSAVVVAVAAVKDCPVAPVGAPTMLKVSATPGKGFPDPSCTSTTKGANLAPGCPVWLSPDTLTNLKGAGVAVAVAVGVAVEVGVGAGAVWARVRVTHEPGSEDSTSRESTLAAM